MKSITHTHPVHSTPPDAPSDTDAETRTVASFVPLVAPLLAVLALVLATLASGVAQAQGSWAGIRSGYPFGVSAHYGIVDGLDTGTDLRITARAYARGGEASIGVGLDALRTIAVEAPFEVYVGGGPAVGIRGSGDFFVNAHGLVGGEFRFSDVDLPQLGVFVEAAAGLTIQSNAPVTFPDLDASVGFNWHF